MQRVITFIVVLVLFGLGLNVVASGFALPSMPYKVPEDPTMAAVLVGTLVGVLVLVVIAGGGLSFIFNFIGASIEKDKPGSLSSSAPSGTLVPPYVPSYSYKPVPENVQTRSWIIYSVIGLVLLGIISSKQLIQIFTSSTFDFTILAIGGGIAVGIVVLVIALGAGLSFLFSRTVLEQPLVTKAPSAAPAPEVKATVAKAPSTTPVVAEVKATDEKIKSPKKSFSINKFVIFFGVFIVVAIVAVVVILVVPGVSQALALDKALQPITSLFEQDVPGGPSAQLKRELAALPKGNAASGQKLFSTVSATPCSTCHALIAEQIIVGPSLAGIATRAPKRKPGYSTELYIYESITNPSAFVVPNFQDGLMPKTFKTVLKPQELSDLIAYLVTLK